MKMKPIDERKAQIVLLLIRAALNEGGDVDKRLLHADPIDWEGVYNLAMRQGVGAIVWDGLMTLHKGGEIDMSATIGRELRLKWALTVERIEKRYARQRSALARLGSMLAEDGIRLSPLKGYGLSLCYPTPEHRSCSDVDIWLFGEQQRADEILRTKYNITIDEGKHHHTVFYIDGVMVENHYDFLNIHAHHSSRPIERYLKEQAATSNERVEVDGTMVYLPAVDCHALFILRHAASHFAATEIVLRHVIDWGLFIKRYHNTIDWCRLRTICQEQHMEQLLDAMNGIASEVCGINIALMPNTTRRMELEQRILGDILQPEFSLKKPERGVLRIIGFKLRRWWANRWKHRLVYSDGLIHSFITQTWSHLKKPKGIKA